jgi:hypothetical protein
MKRRNSLPRQMFNFSFVAASNFGRLAPYVEELICAELVSGLLQKVAGSREPFN